MNLREQAKNLEEERRRKQAEINLLANAFKSVAASPDGKTVLGWVLAQGGLFSEEFSKTANNAYEDGKRAICVRVWNKLKEHARRDDFIAICIGEEKDG